MKVGFIGAGTVARTFGRHLIIAGHTVVVSNSRGPATLANFVADLGRHRGDQGAGGRVRRRYSRYALGERPEALKGIDWRGRILIDATNAHMDPKPDISLAGVTRSRSRTKGAHIERDGC